MRDDVDEQHGEELSGVGMDRLSKTVSHRSSRAESKFSVETAIPLSDTQALDKLIDLISLLAKQQLIDQQERRETAKLAQVEVELRYQKEKDERKQAI